MIASRIKKGLAVFAFAGIPLVTAATCDPYSGAFDFFRDDDGFGYYDPYYYSDPYYYTDVYYYEDYYYEDPYYYDCYFCW